jgi:hypothetical protein
MKKLLVTLSYLSVLSVPLALADHGDREQRMREHLGLSDAQVEQIRQIRAEGGGRDEISAVLTEEQREKAAQMRKHRREHRSERGLERMQERLNLSDDQVAEIRRIRSEGGGRDEVEQVLTDEQREQAEALRERHRGKRHD